MSSTDQKKVGEIISAECKDGPVVERGCTDLICLIIFLAVFVALFGIAIYGFTKGKPTLLYTPSDPDGNFCGYSDNATDYPYIYFVAPSATTLYRTTCVKTCPTANSTKLDCLVNSLVTECTGTVISQSTSSNSSSNSSTSNSSSNTSAATTNSTSNTSSARLLEQIKDFRSVKDILITHKGHKKLINAHHLASSYNYSEVVMIYPSIAFSTACLPQLQTYLSTVLSALNLDGIVEVVEDLELTYPIAFACCGIALVLGFVFMVLTRFCAKFIIWLFILLCIVGFLFLGIVYVMQAQGISVSTTGNWASVASVISQAQSTNYSTTTSWIIGIVCLVIGGLLLILVSCFFSRIRLATAIIESAALFVAQNPTALFVPLFNFITILVWIVFSIFGFLFLVSTGTVTNVAKHLPYGNFSLDSTGEGLAVFFFIGFIWVFAFILHMAHFIFGLATAFWYFNRMQKVTDHPILTATKWFFKYHIGSVALGSGIIALIWLIQMVLSFIAKQQKQAQNKCGEFCIKCIMCCVSCFERFIAYLSKNSYTYIGMTAKNFCPAAWEVFQMILRNPLRFSITGFLGDVFQIFGEVFICCLTGIIGYQIINNVDTYSETLNSPFWPTVVFLFIGFVIGSLFMTVYGSVADAILIIFVLDEEIHKNHLGKSGPEQVPAPLQDFVKQAEEHNSAFQ